MTKLILDRVCLSSPQAFLADLWDNGLGFRRRRSFSLLELAAVLRAIGIDDCAYRESQTA